MEDKIMKFYMTHYICKSEEEFIDELVKGLSFDCDITGQNGDEYLRDDTVKAGYDNDIKYLYNLCKKEKYIAYQYNDICTFLVYLIDNLLSNYYECEYDVIEIEKGTYSIALTCETKDSSL